MKISKKSEKIKKDATLALKYNLFILLFCLILFLISVYIPDWCKIQIKSLFVMNHILPLAYFSFFSFFFGFIFLYGVKDMKPYLLDLINKETLDIGIIASYTGSIAIIASMFVKKIIEHVIDSKIPSSPIHDLFGFIIGRIILLSVFYIFKLSDDNKTTIISEKEEDSPSIGDVI